MQFALGIQSLRTMEPWRLLVPLLERSASRGAVRPRLQRLPAQLPATGNLVMDGNRDWSVTPKRDKPDLFTSVITLPCGMVRYCVFPKYLTHAAPPCTPAHTTTPCDTFLSAPVSSLFVSRNLKKKSF